MRPATDLVRDSKLKTAYRDGITRHVIETSDRRHGHRRIKREQRWQRVGDILGEGAFGIVWKETLVGGESDAKDRAVKRIRKRIGGSTAVDYSRELEAIAKFSRGKYKSFFVESYGWFESQDYVFITMEYFEHGDLQVYLSQVGKMPEEDVRTISYQILEGVNEMHENGFAHRDLKPSNVLIRRTKEHEEGWWVKLGDFGISKRAEEGMTALRTVGGTEGFLAPEVLVRKGSLFLEAAILSKLLKNKREHIFAVDIWALGEITYRAICGTSPFVTDLATYANGKAGFPTDSLKGLEVSRESIELIQQLMKVSPEERLTATEALDHTWFDEFRDTSSRSSGEFQSVDENHEIPSDLLSPMFGSGNSGSFALDASESAPWTDLDGNNTLQPTRSLYDMSRAAGSSSKSTTREETPTTTSRVTPKSSNQLPTAPSQSYSVYDLKKTPHQAHVEDESTTLEILHTVGDGETAIKNFEPLQIPELQRHPRAQTSQQAHPGFYAPSMESDPRYNIPFGRPNQHQYYNPNTNLLVQDVSAESAGSQSGHEAPLTGSIILNQHSNADLSMIAYGSQPVTSSRSREHIRPSSARPVKPGNTPRSRVSREDFGKHKEPEAKVGTQTSKLGKHKKSHFSNAEGTSAEFMCEQGHLGRNDNLNSQRDINPTVEGYTSDSSERNRKPAVEDYDSEQSEYPVFESFRRSPATTVAARRREVAYESIAEGRARPRSPATNVAARRRDVGYENIAEERARWESDYARAEAEYLRRENEKARNLRLKAEEARYPAIPPRRSEEPRKAKDTENPITLPKAPGVWPPSRDGHIRKAASDARAEARRKEEKRRSYPPRKNALPSALDAAHQIQGYKAEQPSRSRPERTEDDFLGYNIGIMHRPPMADHSISFGSQDANQPLAKTDRASSLSPQPSSGDEAQMPRNRSPMPKIRTPQPDWEVREAAKRQTSFNPDQVSYSRVIGPEDIRWMPRERSVRKSLEPRKKQPPKSESKEKPSRTSRFLQAAGFKPASTTTKKRNDERGRNDKVNQRNRSPNDVVEVGEDWPSYDDSEDDSSAKRRKDREKRRKEYTKPTLGRNATYVY